MNQIVNKVNNLCKPAKIYFIISVISFLAMLMQNCTEPFVYKIGTIESFSPCNNIWFFLTKAFYILVWTYGLNYFCDKNLSGVSWALVLLPFLGMFLGIGATMFSLMKISENMEDSATPATKEDSPGAQPTIAPGEKLPETEEELEEAKKQQEETEDGAKIIEDSKNSGKTVPKEMKAEEDKGGGKPPEGNAATSVAGDDLGDMVDNVAGGGGGGANPVDGGGGADLGDMVDSVAGGGGGDGNPMAGGGGDAGPMDSFGNMGSFFSVGSML